jgi:DNA-binding NtrC family response regulator
VSAVTDQKYHLLLVDDEPTVRRMLRMALEEHGFILDDVETAEIALTHLRERPYAMVITDKNLPGMSGLELLRQAREIQPQIRAMLITGYASVASALETMRLGVDGLLEKPFADVYAVAEKIREVLARPARRPTGHTIDRDAASGHFNRAMAVLQAARDAGANASAPSESSLRVAVINPSAPDRDWLVQRLRHDGDEVDTYGSIDAARDRLERTPPDVLLIDVGCGEREVLAVVEENRRQLRGTTPVVTAERPSLNAVVRMIDAGVRTVVDKPFRDDTFRQQMAPVLGAARAGKTARRG